MCESTTMVKSWEKCQWIIETFEPRYLLRLN